MADGVCVTLLGGLSQTDYRSGRHPPVEEHGGTVRRPSVYTEVPRHGSPALVVALHGALRSPGQHDCQPLRCGTTGRYDPTAAFPTQSAVRYAARAD